MRQQLETMTLKLVVITECRTVVTGKRNSFAIVIGENRVHVGQSPFCIWFKLLLLCVWLSVV